MKQHYSKKEKDELTTGHRMYWWDRYPLEFDKLKRKLWEKELDKK